MLFDLFTHHIQFRREMKIVLTGLAVNAIIPNIVGKNLNDMFYSARPVTKLTYHDACLQQGIIIVIIID